MICLIDELERLHAATMTRRARVRWNCVWLLALRSTLHGRG